MYAYFHGRIMAVIVSYVLSDNWVSLVEDVRAGRLVTHTLSVVWHNGTKHGLQECGISRDMISFISRRTDRTATREEFVTGLPAAFYSVNKPVQDNAQDYLRELVKMGILIKFETGV